MDDYMHRGSTTSNVLAWTSHSANVEPSVEEEAGDADEPPDPHSTISPLSSHFKRAPLRRGCEHPESLLTKALQSHSEDDHNESNSILKRRRRSMTSNVSVASTTELTCSTGITTPARTSTPSPRLLDIGFVPQVCSNKQIAPPSGAVGQLSDAIQESLKKDPAVQALEKKRCISFACLAKPKSNTKPVSQSPPRPTLNAPKPVEQAAPKRTCVKFVCPSQPGKTAPPQEYAKIASTPLTKDKLPERDSSPATVVKHRSPSALRSARSSTPRRSSHSPVSVRTSKKWLTADSKDLQSECSRFHAFASDELEEDDWIRRDAPVISRKLTIDDTLEKENVIRKLGQEVEEEAELEEELDDEADAEDDDTEGEDEDELDGGEAGVDEERDTEVPEDDRSGYDSDDDGGSDGYNTDNEVGFADSDDEDDDLVLWTTGQATHFSLSGATPIRRRSSFAGEILSDSSVYAKNKPRVRGKRAAARPVTPELPDSTDFVCGTLDEDRPLEEAYMSCIAARRREKLHPIPQDIDPSFPTSEPEDDVEAALHHSHQGSDEHMWLHGDMEDVYDDSDRKSRRHKKKQASPKRYRSPAPAKRLQSPPAPKVRGRSPRRLFDGRSPRLLTSPQPALVSRSPAVSPVHNGQGIDFKTLASRPGLVYTKSLPRASAMFGQVKNRRGRSGTITKENHVRGAIDIVKGLEQKRQRRKEKFYQKYCTRARKNPAQTKRPAPGQGAQRMREVGLTMAGKLGQGNFVLSV